MWINGSDVDPGTLAPIDKDSKKEEPRGIDALPPDYTVLKKWEAALPQHNLTLPFPEGKKGRYVKFSNQSGGIGWNNCFNEVLMNAHLAYVSGRGYVFRDYYWSAEHYRWPREKWTSDQPHTPLNAIVSGPVSGGPFDAGDPAPRAISEEWFDVVCPVNALTSQKGNFQPLTRSPHD
ncbi:hypothetical protein R3P38DRAFT_2520195 [Favolaschia claudopus]|uniref:Uncharacterized protein n=1 Tax=Favolaschia claudopus TaxID=2862362 RepID=A0AAW0C3J4_9AGAR